jgi:polyisoprenoid-binding protein YceI
MKARQLFYAWIGLFAILSTHGISQTTYEVDADNSKIWVDGTSTLKKWSAQVKSMHGTLTVDDNGQIGQVELSIDASTMDGGRGADMNNKIYKALKTSEHPNIVFKGQSASASDGHDLASMGTIMVAGESMPIKIQADGSMATRITGSSSLKLSDFNIEPPTAMFGQIVCHDDLTIGFDLSLKKLTP